MSTAAIALEDGKIFYGRAFGAHGVRYGEVVFNTSMTGYQEILTDPSYKGQIVTMTYPQIGNYGTNHSDNESGIPHVEGFVVKELSPRVSNHRAEESLSAFLKRHNKIGIQGVDTRALTRHIRSRGAMRAVIATVDLTPDILIERARGAPSLVGRDLVQEVTTGSTYEFTKESADLSSVTGRKKRKAKDTGFLVVAYDFGIKENIMHSLIGRGLRVMVVPAHTPADDVLAMKPNGVSLSNGPGDPEGIPYAISEIRKLINSIDRTGPILRSATSVSCAALARSQ